VVASPSIITRFLAFNMLVKPYDNPKVREAIGYAINKEALAKVAFGGYAFPAQGMRAAGREVRREDGPIPYDLKKAKELLKEAGYPNGFESVLWSAYNNTTSQKTIQFVQQQLATGRHQAAGAGARSGPAHRAGRCNGPIRRRPRCACTTRAGRRRPVKRTGACARCSPRKPGRPS
jgi:hypothetical protein